MSHRLPTSAVLRILLNALLALGLCMQPVWAAACEIADASSAGEAPAADAASGERLHAADADAGQRDACCPEGTCSDSCLHATAGLTPGAAALPAPPAPAYAVSPPAGVPPGHYPVAIRPPLQG